MRQKSLIIGLLMVISAIGWDIVRQSRAVGDGTESRVRSAATNNRDPEGDPGMGGMGVVSGGGGAWRDEAIRYGWHLEYQDALDAAREASKPLMIVYRCIP